MSDQVTHVSHESWGSRLAGSIKGILFGGALFVSAFPLLFWNEGRAVRSARSLEEGAGAVVSVSSDRIDPLMEGKLVHTTGTAAAPALRDEDLGVAATASTLERKVEMYQWKESSRSQTRKNLGGGTETVTTTTYARDWSSTVVDSAGFKEPAGHQNPNAFPIEGRTHVAEGVKVGAFELTPGQVSGLGRAEPVRIESNAEITRRFGDRATVQDGVLFVGRQPGAPEVGDLRISFAARRPGPVSIVGRQVARGFEPYRTGAGGDVLILRDGTSSADAMFEAAQSASATMTWILRVVGFFLMFLGVSSVLRPLSVLADVVPMIGDLVGTGTTLVAGAAAAAAASATIAVGWIFYRPLVGLLLLAVAGAAVAGLVMLMMRTRRGQAASPAVAA